jgi:hypothetical protein
VAAATVAAAGMAAAATVAAAGMAIIRPCSS